MERFEADTIAEALQHARDQRADPRFDQVLSVSSVLVDGVVVRGGALDQPTTGAIRAEILPPFAGGSAREVASSEHHSVEDNPALS